MNTVLLNETRQKTAVEVRVVRLGVTHIYCMDLGVQMYIGDRLGGTHIYYMDLGLYTYIEDRLGGTHIYWG